VTKQYNEKIEFKSELIQVAFLTVLAVLIHAIVLKFIYPGYYSPLYPHHSDFYIPAALANSPKEFFQYNYLGYARPLGIFSLKIIGLLGIHGSIVFTIINVAVNCSLSATLFRVLLNVKFNGQFIIIFLLYTFILFSHPYFYTFYSQDVLSHLSYLFLLTGFYIYIKYRIRYEILATGLLFCFSTIGFLCKETYGLTFTAITFIGFVYTKREHGSRIIAPFIIIILSLSLALSFNLLIKSVFIDFKNNATTSPYYISLNPISIASELYRYSKEALNYINASIIILIGIGLYLYNKTNFYLYFTCILTAILSWVPNSLIPNHHIGGYSFNGTYILYLPLFFIIPFWNQKKNFWTILMPLFGAILISPLLDQKEYNQNKWILEQENTQRNILQSLDTLMPALKPETSGNKRNILLTGLTMPFYPFHHPLSLKDYPNSNFANFDIVNYTKDENIYNSTSIKLLPISAIPPISKYSSIWLFTNDGKFIGEIIINSLPSDSIQQNKILDLILHPNYSTSKEIKLILNKTNSFIRN